MDLMIYDQRNDIKKTLVEQDHVFYINTRDVWNVRLGQNIGTELHGKTDFMRPFLILAKLGHSYFGVPLTSKQKESIFYYTLDTVLQEGKISTACLSQCKVLDKKRFTKRLGCISKQDFVEIKNHLQTLLFKDDL